MKFRGVISLRKLLPTVQCQTAADPRAVEDILEIDEDALRRFRTQKGRSLFAAQGPDVGLEHQVELARRRQRAESLASGPSTWRSRDLGQADKVTFPVKLVGVFCRQS